MKCPQERGKAISVLDSLAIKGSGIKGVKAGPGPWAATPYIVSKAFPAARPFMQLQRLYRCVLSKHSFVLVSRPLPPRAQPGAGSRPVRAPPPRAGAGFLG